MCLLQEENFPKSVASMVGLKWMKLNRTNLDWIPEELGNLNQLESLALARNNLVSLHGEISTMTSLRSLNCRRNCLKTSSLPSSIFKLQELTILDLSHNQMKEIPEELEYTQQLLLLNLSHNLIESIPNQLFVSLCDLKHLDLSFNKLGNIHLILCVLIVTNLFFSRNSTSTNTKTSQIRNINLE